MNVGFQRPVLYENPLQKGKRMISTTISRGMNFFKFKNRFHRILAMVLAALVAIPVGIALADVINPDGDTVTTGNQSTVNLGYVRPGTPLTQQASFQLQCVNNQTHAQPGETGT